MILPLQSLRGLFALVVFLHHFPWGGRSAFAAGGDAGVTFFFMLSGFVMSMAYGGRIKDYPAYMRARICKIYPLHWLCMLAFIMAVPDLHILERIPATIINMALLQSYVPRESVYFSYNAVAWFLCDMLFCYAVFPLLWRAVDSGIKRALWLLVSVLFSYAVICAVVPESIEVWVVYICPPVRCVDFLLGMLLWRWCGVSGGCATDVAENNIAGRTVVELLVLAFGIAAVVAWYHLPEILGLASLWWMPWGALIAVFSRSGGLVSRLLCCKPLLWLGKISFPFFMVHYIIITVMKPYVGNGVVCEFLWLGAALCVSLLAGWLVTRYFMPLCRNKNVSLRKH